MTQGFTTNRVTGSVAVTNFPAYQAVSISGIPTFIPSGNNYIGTVSGAFSATINAAYIPSGNVFIVSGNAWNGTGSTYVVNGAGSFAIQGVLGSVAVTNFPATQNVAVSGIPSFVGSVNVNNYNGSVYNINTPLWTDAGSVYLINGASVGSLATQGVIGSIAVTNFPATQPVSLAAPWTGVGSTYTTGSVTATVNSLPVGSIYGIGVGSVYAQVAGSVTVINSSANPSTAYGKTLSFVPLAQGAAGTTQIGSATVGSFNKLMGAVLTMSLSGTVKFTDGVADLTGAMDVSQQGGFVMPTSIIPYTQTQATNRALNIVTTTGAAKGFVIILTEA